MLISQQKISNLSYQKISLFMLIFFIVDIFFKKIALSGLISFTPNYYLALSLDILPTWIILIFHSVVTILFIYFLVDSFFSKKNKLYFVALFLIVIGAFSNLTDRLTEGFVVDYLDLFFFQNNLADIYIWIGIIILTFYLFSKKTK